MTREITTYVKPVGKEYTNTHTHANGSISVHQNKNNELSLLFKNVTTVIKGAVKAKREISDRFVLLTETLADKTAREGLFGEDKGKGYCGTDVDFIG